MKSVSRLRSPVFEVRHASVSDLRPRTCASPDAASNAPPRKARPALPQQVAVKPQAAGAHVPMAINHWPRAVTTHALNHPSTAHACQDLSFFDHSRLPDRDLLIASLSYVSHTRVRGRERRHHDATRATAWCVIDAVEAKQPKQFVVENVPDFLSWQLCSVWRRALRARLLARGARAGRL